MRIANVLDALRRACSRRAKRRYAKSMKAENKEAAEAALGRFQENCGAKYPKAVARLLKDQEALPISFDLPAEHRIHLRSTNAIE
ncbi:MAG TPA: transposase [Candidatus Acidoferrales bacterium]|nr:transposase [Candidatus Acidoferrales bacterium]